MASLSFLLGMIPATEKVETAEDTLRAEHRAFTEYEESEELKHFQELEKEVKSSEFAIRKKRLKKKEYKDSEEYQKESEYDVLRKSEKVVWYFKTRKKNPFRELEKWELTFGDEFQGSKLDTSKWMTRYYWGEKGLDESFALGDEKSFPTNGKNIEFYDKKLRIVTKAEKAEGLQWRPEVGFVRENFEVTTGMISTAASFRQKYGIFQAKIKMAPGSVAQAFWMVSEEMLPHIDVARFENGKLHADYFWGKGQSPNKSVSRTGGSRYADHFYIYTLEWSPNKLVWKINGKVFKTQSSGVPQEEMCVNFSSNLKLQDSDSGLPSAMEIDWVRVYKLKAEG